MSAAQRRDLLLALPAVLLLGVAIVLVISHGGYSATTWYPAALFVLALLAVLLATGVAGSRIWAGPARLAMLAYAGYVAWSYLSIAWAEIPAQAWDGANRSLLYGMVLAVTCLRRWTVADLRLVLSAVSAACALIAIGVLIAGTGAHPEHLFLEGRLADPTGYANATPNLWLIGCFPALWLSIDREVRWAVRGAALGVATLLAQMSLLSQSRGAVAAFILVAILFVAASPRRWAALGALGAVLVAMAATSAPVLDVHDAAASKDLGPLLHDASLAILLATLGMAGLGMLAAWQDERWAAESRFGANTRTGNRWLAGLTAAVVLVGIIGMGNPGTWVSDRWDDFKNSGYTQVDQPGQTRLTASLGSQRYDVYRVALNDFAEHPFLGVGVDSFGPSYLLHGKTDQNPRYAHSVVMSLLAETGIIGTLFFAAFLVLTIRALVRASRASPTSHGPVIAATCAAAVFFAGAMFDWLWQFPALGVIGFLVLGMAINHVPAREEQPDDIVPGFGADELPTGAAAVEPAPVTSAWRVGPVLPRILGGALAVACGLSLIAPGIAARFVAAAYDDAATDPALAIRRLNRAVDLNPLSTSALLTKNVLLRRQGRTDEAMAALAAAAEREPDNWFIPFERGLLEAKQKRWKAALADLRRAKALNPRQTVIDYVIDATQDRRVFDADKAETWLAEQTSRRLKPTG